MAVVSPSSSLETLDPKPDKSEPTENPNPNPNPNPEPVPSTTPSLPPENPNPVALPPPTFAPSFRPLGMPPAPHYSAVPNPNPGVMYQGGIQPPGVSIMPPMRPGMMYPPPPYGQAPNGYMAGPPGLAPPGIPRYPGPYPTMIRPGFPPRPMPPMGVIPQIPRPPIPGVHGIPPAPMVRPVLPIVAPTEKPQTTVYVGKISPSADNDFLLSLLRLCGPVKSWKRAQDPTDGTPKGFGFCEFEAAEGVLRALRLLTKLSIDGQELVLNINQATREYLERYVEKKTEREKLKETASKGVEKENESAPGVEKQGHPKPDVEETKKEEDSGDKENHENQKFGIVTDEDSDADRDALEKLTSIIEERIKNRPLPPPPPVQTPADTSAKSHSEIPSKSRDGDSDVEIMRSAEDKNDDETTSEAKPPTEHDKPETNSPDRIRRHDRRSRERDRDRERDLKRDKERELERYERERERERVRRERERDMKIKEGERLYRDRVKDWEDRERDRERHRRDEKEREKERQRKRQNEILKDEDGSDDDEDDGRKRRRRSSMLEEKRRKRQREKEDDLHDRLKEEEEIAEAKKKAIEEQKQEDLKPPLIQVIEDNEDVMMQEDRLTAEDKEMSPSQQAYETITSNGDDTGDVSYRNSSGGEFSEGSVAVPGAKQNEAPTKKLGFGLIGSGKRTTVPSVFHEEDDENVDDKKMRPLVPIDYSTEELQAVQTTLSSAPANLVAAAEFAKRISGVTPKEEKPDLERERNGRSNDRTGHRERDRKDAENTHYRNESKEKIYNRSSERERDRERDKDRDKDREDKPKTENKKLLDAKQLIDMIPKTKEELFAYEINWAVYDKHELHERMGPWISKKITEFLGEEEATLVDYIVSSTKEHVQASKMLELLQSILDDEAEMFVLKMWRMLIFEIKKVETGISVKPRA
ncbi:RNA-binding protein 25 isoform X4 [Iris pallida]|uniref:RNA-binding protein 25 isoform X4 n=1 Tax=Iris pallida TaxID=29817 RepID=A0AAX6HTJ2_IRIPA|nr:RNA-binding protein 25 isoform X4 [Iris pallida]